MKIPIENCPYCETECEADWVDVGVGFVQCGPFYCIECEASQIGPNDPIFDPDKNYHNPEGRELTDREKETWWYEPNTPVTSIANTFLSHLVDHKTAKKLYELGILDRN